MASQIPTSASLRGEGIDAARACRILGVSSRTLQRLATNGLIEWFDRSKLSWKLVRYYSIVEFCDRLREDHGITDRRSTLSPPFVRHSDEDLLPFPLHDTITGHEALALLHLSKIHSLVKLVRDGRFDAYQFSPQAPWRVSRSSLLAYLAQEQAVWEECHAS